MAIDSSGIPTTGPEAIYHGLQNLDLDKKEKEAQSVIQRKLKSKRPDAVKILGYIQGMRKSGIQPHELMINRVPVIPPQFRPYSVAGDTFVPGDANELYRDLINLVGVHGEIEGALGKAGSGKSRLNVYDAVKAVYGFGEPTSPKTRA
jgi:DNA-directed RNA polymerase beta' subunit